MAAFDRIFPGSALRVTLNAHVVGADRLELRGVHDRFGTLILNVLTSRTVTALAPNVPFRHRFGLDVVVDRMTPIAQGTRRPLHLVIGVHACPPVGARLRGIRAPRLVLDVPLRREDEVVVATFGEVALLPFAAVDERDVANTERDERVRAREISDDRVRMLLRVPHDVRHQRAFPPGVNVAMARFARGGTDELPRGRRCCRRFC